MRFFHLMLLFCFSLTAATAGEKGQNIYNPEADAGAQLKQAVKDARTSNKHILVIIGGNWCSWCKKLDHLFQSNQEVSDALAANYEVVHINYSPENRNEKILKELEYPQRFGFPVLLVLDDQGKRLHTQNSGYLEEGKGHSPAKVLSFLKDWAPSALDATKY